jgi:hypothetical protein
VSHIRSELPDQNHLVDPGTTDPADPQLSTVVTGATAEGQKEVITIGDGLRESTESWREVLRDLRDRGLKCGARLAVGDGALGFWGAFDGDLSGNASPEMLDAQDWERAQRIAEVVAVEGEGGIA